MPADGAYINTGLVVPHRKRPGRALLPGEEEDNAEHRKVVLGGGLGEEVVHAGLLGHVSSAPSPA
ncbi:hypothetical protein CU044_2462 [Streptomyces sp. L-9-10]|nr:hypothetical protein CU044_2462 [Streptomyces sp. L-9-10]